VIKARQSHNETDVTAPAKRDDEAEGTPVMSGGNDSGNAPEQYRTREDLEKAYNDAKNSEAQLRKIIDTIPTLAWCNFSDGSNEFVNQRWSD
jgi:hypothetical protein